MGLKTLLKQIFPMSASSMQYELSQLLLQIQKISDLQEKLLQTTQALLSYSKTLEEQETRLNSLIELQKSEIVLFKKLIQHQDELFQKHQNTTDKLLEKKCRNSRFTKIPSENIPECRASLVRGSLGSCF